MPSRYRYTLSRKTGVEGGRVCFVLLNPSTATDTEDDPTVRRCVGFARRLGFAELEIVNLFARRATRPRELAFARDPVGRGNDDAIAAAAARADLLIAGWGNHGRLLGRAAAVLPLLGGRMHCLSITRLGEPGHPLYLPATATLLPLPRRVRRPITAPA